MLARRAWPRLQPALQRHKHIHPSLLRAFSTTELSNGVTLAYDLHEPAKDKKGGGKTDAPAIVFIHGLFGSKKNNRGMSK